MTEIGKIRKTGQVPGGLDSLGTKVAQVLTDIHAMLMRRAQLRRTIHALGALSDHDLADIGFERENIRAHAQEAVALAYGPNKV